MEENLIEEFLKGNVIVNTKTLDAYNKLIDYLEKETDVIWSNGLNLLDACSYYSSFKENTCFKVYEGVHIWTSSISYWEEDTERIVVDFEELGINNQPLVSYKELTECFNELKLKVEAGDVKNVIKLIKGCDLVCTLDKYLGTYVVIGTGVQNMDIDDVIKLAKMLHTYYNTPQAYKDVDSSTYYMYTLPSTVKNDNCLGVNPNNVNHYGFYKRPSNLHNSRQDLIKAFTDGEVEELPGHIKTLMSALDKTEFI